MLGDIGTGTISPYRGVVPVPCLPTDDRQKQKEQRPAQCAGRANVALEGSGPAIELR
jgi:hypothetical protein